jgi:hypothetical protein
VSQIFLGLLVASGGNPIGYEIFEGNILMIIRNHTTTLKIEAPTNIVEVSIEIKIDAHAPVI